MVNLSERISSSIDCDPWFVVTASRKHRPGDASEFVGERYRQQIAMREAFGSSFDPRPQSPHRCGRPPYQDDVGGLNEQRPEISVAALGDLAELGAIAGRLLLRYQTEPSAEIAALTEAIAVADRSPDRFASLARNAGWSRRAMFTDPDSYFSVHALVAK